MIDMLLTGLQIIATLLLAVLLWVIAKAFGATPIEGLKKIILRWFQK